MHTHTTKNHDLYKGIKIKEITSKFQVETMAFVKVFTCEVCDLKSCGLEEHSEHFKKEHENVQYGNFCLFNNCEFTTLFPEELVKHFSENHQKTITNILKKNL